MKDIKVDVKLTEKEFYKFQLVHQRRVLGKTAYLLILFYAAIIIKLIMAIIDGINIAFAVAVFIVPLIVFVTITISSKKSFESNKFLQAENHYTITASGLTVESDHGSFKGSWTDLHLFHESNELLLFYIARNQAYIVPKRGLNKEELIYIRKCVQKIKKPDKQKSIYRNIFIYVAVVIILIAVVTALGLSYL